ncbi:MAG: ABC transporter substrate-binding protein [Syntrophorhabdaceae bacterium]|nr:ABC transporter substrate-binding protein [Syntrophorhabdaceae bacterium]
MKNGFSCPSCYIFSLIFCLSLFFLAPPVSWAGDVKRASFIPQWSPQAQFAGYYVAYDKGFYKKHGIELNLIEGGPERASAMMLERKEVDFTTIWLSQAIKLRSRGVRLINVGQVIHRSALMLVAKKARGILSPKDINGKKVGLWREEFQLQPLAFFKKYGLKVQVVPQSYSINLFLRDGVDVASAMWYNEYHMILNAGLNPEELTTFFFYDHGLNFPEDGIYTMEKTWREDRELVRSFVKASLEGWLYAINHQEETLKIIMKYMHKANVPANIVHQRWMLARMKDLLIPDEKDGSFPFILNRNDFSRVCGILKESNLVKNLPDYNDFYINVMKHVDK